MRDLDGPIPPLYLPYTSPIPPLYLPYTSPIPPLYIPYISQIVMRDLDGRTVPEQVPRLGLLGL